jgi:ketosteroid isomerase-like protein
VLRLIAICVTAISVLAGCGGSDRADIEAALLQWPRDFNARNLDAVCGLFADDVVLAYPGAPDRNRDAFCDQMRDQFRDPSKTFSYDEPDIKEIIVDGDLATVRLFWTLTVRDTSGRFWRRSTKTASTSSDVSRTAAGRSISPMRLRSDTGAVGHAGTPNRKPAAAERNGPPPF